MLAQLTVADPLDAPNVSRLLATPDGNGVVPVSVVVVDPGSVNVFVPPPVAVMRMKEFAPVIMTAPVPPVVTSKMPNDFPPPANVFDDDEVSEKRIVPVVDVTVRFVDVAQLKPPPVQMNVEVLIVSVRVPVPLLFAPVTECVYDPNLASPLLHVIVGVPAVPVKASRNSTLPPTAAIVIAFVKVCPALVNVNTPRPSIVKEVVPLFVIKLVPVITREP